MTSFLFVGLGGAVGAMARYGVGLALAHLRPEAKFPWATLSVNVIGCFLIGLLAGLGERNALLNPDLRLFLVVGMLGGFTTFSTFGYDNFELLRRQELLLAVSNLTVTLLLGIPAVWLGHGLAHRVG